MMLLLYVVGMVLSFVPSVSLSSDNVSLGIVVVDVDVVDFEVG